MVIRKIGEAIDVAGPARFIFLEQKGKSIKVGVIAEKSTLILRGECDEHEKGGPIAGQREKLGIES